MDEDVGRSFLNDLPGVVLDAFWDHIRTLKKAGDRARDSSLILDLESRMLDFSNVPSAAASFRALATLSDDVDQANRVKTRQLRTVADLLERVQLE